MKHIEDLLDLAFTLILRKEVEDFERSEFYNKDDDPMTPYLKALNRYVAMTKESADRVVKNLLKTAKKK